jgi:hypothetical protein
MPAKPASLPPLPPGLVLTNQSSSAGATNAASTTALDVPPRSVRVQRAAALSKPELQLEDIAVAVQPAKNDPQSTNK